MFCAFPSFTSPKFLKDMLLLSSWCIGRTWRTEKFTSLLEVIYLTSHRAGIQSNTISPSEVSVVNMFTWNKNLSAWATWYVAWHVWTLNMCPMRVSKIVICHDHLPHCPFRPSVLLPGPTVDSLLSIPSQSSGRLAFALVTDNFVISGLGSHNIRIHKNL